MKEKKSVSAIRNKAAATASSKTKVGSSGKLKRSTTKIATNAKDLFSHQDNSGTDLNTNTGSPLHPNHIWPD